MQVLAIEKEKLQQALDEEESALFGDSRQHALWRDSTDQGFESALYCGQTIELKFYDAEGKEWIEVDFLTEAETFVWRKDSQKGIPDELRELITKHGYRIHTNFNQMPKRLRDVLT